MKKIKISTLSIDNVTKRLQNGEIIYFDNKISYKIVNNLLCRFEYDKCTDINVSLTFGDGDHYYFRKEDPIKFEVGKHYKTRIGTEAVCYIILKDTIYRYIFIELNTGKQFSTTINGNCFEQFGSNYDIIDYWKD